MQHTLILILKIILYFLIIVVFQWLSHVQLFSASWTAAWQASLPRWVCSKSCPLSQWSYLTILLSSAALFSFCLQSFPASGSFPVSWLFTSGNQSIGDSASGFLVNVQGWFPSGLTGLIFLLSKGLSRIFSRNTIRKHQLFGVQSSL